MYVEAIRKAEDDRLARQVHAGMLTEPVQFAGDEKAVQGAGQKAAGEPVEVKALLWKVLRRKFAIEAIGALDRQAEKMTSLEQQLVEMENGMRSKWAESQDTLKSMTEAVATGITAIPQNLERLSIILSSLEAFAAREEEALQKRALLKASVAQAMGRMRSRYLLARAHTR